MANRNLLAISARDLMNFAYCKRIVYFERVLRAPQSTTVKEVEGRRKHATQARLEKKREGRKHFNWTRKLLEIRLDSPRLGCSTILDLLLIDDNAKVAVPMQFKNSEFPGFIYRGQRQQIFLESAIVEDALGLEVPFGLVKFLKDGKVIRVEFGENEKLKLNETLDEMNRMIKDETLPEPTEQTIKCRDCCFRRICARA